MSITALPDIPSRSDSATFSTKADAFLGALPTFATEANALEANVNAMEANVTAKDATAAAAAATASAASALALAAANYKGEWSAQSGAATIPYCVSHPANSYWMLTTNLANVAAKTPGVDPEWVAIGYGFKGVAVTLAGQDGVTVTHNKGDLNYLCKIQPTGIGCLGRIGDISCIKAANTVVIYNSGHGGFLADVEITNINMA